MRQKNMRMILKRFFGLLAIYAIALQAVLGVWAGAANAAQGFDPLAVLCGTASADPASPDRQPSSHRTDCVCGSACTHASMGALAEAPPHLSLLRFAVAVGAILPVEAERGVVWRGSAQARAPPVGV